MYVCCCPFTVLCEKITIMIHAEKSLLSPDGSPYFYGGNAITPNYNRYLGISIYLDLIHMNIEISMMQS